MTTQTLQIAETIAQCRAIRTQWQRETVAFVPTMGALHEGHLSLMRMARQNADRVVVSIFVNPLQFGPNEDFQRYPRTFEADKAACTAEGVDLIFAPAAGELYPADLSKVTTVVPPAHITERFCGLARPGHFTGVATVVLKLFNIVQPDIAIFGEKDAQQLAVIRQMVKDLDIPIRIVGHPIVREASGLAMSSRNRYFTSEAQLQEALLLSKTLYAIRDKAMATPNGLPTQQTLSQAVQDVITSAQPTQLQLEYLDAVDAETFEPVEHLLPGVKLLIAATVHGVRLIDNLTL